MGKIVIAGYQGRRIFREIKGFQESGTVRGTFGTLKVYKKLRVDTFNLLDKEEDFIAGTGTFFYQGKTGKEALERILEDFQDNIDEIRNEITGSYCMAVRKDGKLSVFIDAMGYYRIYYHITEVKEIILTNTYYHIGRVMQHAEVDVDRWMEKDLLDDIVGNETPLRGVLRLKKYEALVFGADGWEIKEIDPCQQEWDMDFWKEMKEIYSEIGGGVIHSHAMWCTAGQDSRLSLALLLSAGIAPEILYGIGNSRKTNTKQTDKDVAKAIAQKFDLKYQNMDWRDTDQEGLAGYIEKYGEYVTLYDFNKNVFRELEERIQTECLHNGVLGANAFRIADPVQQFREPFTLDEYIDELCVNDTIRKACKNWDAFRADLKARLEKECFRLHIDPKRITKQEYRKLSPYGKNDTLNNLFQMFFYCFPLLPSEKYESFVENLSYEEKITSHFLLSGIYELKKEALDLPVLSHHVLKQVDPEKLVITNEQEKVEAMRNLLLPYWRFLKKSKVREWYFLLKKDKKGYEELRKEKAQVKETGKKLRQCKFRDSYDIKKMQKTGDPIYLSRLTISDAVFRNMLERREQKE